MTDPKKTWADVVSDEEKEELKQKSASRSSTSGKRTASGKPEEVGIPSVPPPPANAGRGGQAGPSGNGQSSGQRLSPSRGSPPGRKAGARGGSSARKPAGAAVTTVTEEERRAAGAVVGAFASLPPRIRGLVLADLVRLMGKEVQRTAPPTPGARESTSAGKPAPGPPKPQVPPPPRRKSAWEEGPVSMTTMAKTMAAMDRAARAGDVGRKVNTLLSATTAAVSRARRAGMTDDVVANILMEVENHSIRSAPRGAHGEIPVAALTSPVGEAAIQEILEGMRSLWTGAQRPPSPPEAAAA